MRFSIVSLAVVALAAQNVVADTWLGNAAYNKWHETELERWLSDHNIPYPAASDRKNLQDLVQKNWENNVASPYNNWDTNQLSSYLSTKGYQAKKGTEQSKDSLISQVKNYWTETADTANSAYGNVQNWVFDTWTESQLKSFLDYHGIPNPTPRTRDSLLQTARSNYQSIANKAGEKASYPGDWLYSSWSDSDFKAWLDERGIPVPQPSSRDKLIATLRRNAKIASDSAASKYATASSAAASSQQSLSDTLLNSWSDSQLKEWFDTNGIKVPQGSKRNEMVALARKHSAQLTGGNVKGSAASAFGAATTSASNWYAQNTNGLYGSLRGYYDAALNNFGLASAEASKSLSSASSVASASLSSASSVASLSASSVSSTASYEASKKSNSLSKSASSASSVGSNSASSASSVGSNSASSLSSVNSKSASSASSVASRSSSSASSVASRSASSASSVASKSAASAKAEL